MAAPQLQWDLARTTDSVLSVTKALVRASTSDNVQILAVVACERFGATLAICPETRKKVEHHVLKIQSRPAEVVHFLGAAVGYSRNDCAAYLARSLAGIQFLGLAAALVPSMTTFNAADALARMLELSAVDKTLLPPSRHLKELLNSLEHRCVQLRFSDLAFGWQNILYNAPGASIKNRAFWKLSIYAPGPDGLERLVDAFRQLGRLGDAISVTLKTVTCRYTSKIPSMITYGLIILAAPWVAAFTQWCLGVPPSIVLDGENEALYQPTSKVTLIATQDAENCPDLEIIIHQSIGAPSEMIYPVPTSKGSWAGMLSVECYGQWLLRQHDLDKGFPFRALIQALPYALKQVTTLLQLQHIRRFDRTTPSLQSWHDRKHDGLVADPSILKLVAYPFPKDSAIVGMMISILGTESRSELLSLEDGLLVSDLPLVTTHMKELRKTCECSDCRAPGTSKAYKQCTSKRFLNDIAAFSTRILALSLFDRPNDRLEPLLVRQTWQYSIQNNLQPAIEAIISTGLPYVSSVNALLETALDLTSHDCLKEVRNSSWVISSYKGQAIYPRLFETQGLDESGYLILSWAPGLLRYSDEVFRLGISGSLSQYGSHQIPFQNKDPVTMACNLMQGLDFSWRVSREDEVLNVDLGIGRDGHYSTKAPFQILNTLARALIVEDCPHTRDSKIRTPSPWWSYSSPLSPMSSYKSADDAMKIDVVAVDSNHGFRMFALSAVSQAGLPIPIVVRKQACLDCCLEVCQKAGYPVVVC